MATAPPRALRALLLEQQQRRERNRQQREQQRTQQYAYNPNADAERQEHQAYLQLELDTEREFAKGEMVKLLAARYNHDPALAAEFANAYSSPWQIIDNTGRYPDWGAALYAYNQLRGKTWEMVVAYMLDERHPIMVEEVKTIVQDRYDNFVFLTPPPPPAVAARQERRRRELQFLPVVE